MLTPKKIAEWTERRYMIIDEVSMLDCKVMEGLHKQLTITKSKLEVGFGGMNMIFISDFLQLPAVINPDLYRDTVTWNEGHQLWRSLNCGRHLKGADETGRRPRLHCAPLSPPYTPTYRRRHRDSE